MYKKLLIGTWSYIHEPLYSETGVYSYNFKENNSFEFKYCYFGNNIEEDCINGKAIYKGTYKLENSRIILKIDNFTQIIDRNSFYEAKPSESLIVDFDNMYICDGNDGLDCDRKFEKD